MPQIFVNNAKGKLSAGISAVATSLTLESGQGAAFPTIAAPDFLRMTIFEGTNVEIVNCTAHSAGSDTFTVQRGCEKIGQTAGAGIVFTAAALVAARVTADALQRVTPDWSGRIIAAYGRGDPQQLLRMAQSGSVAATPTNIGTAVARCAYFRPNADIVVNKIRFFGVGAPGASLYRVRIYNADTLVAVTAQLTLTPAAQTWGSVAAGPVTLLKDQLYIIAVAVNATGTVAGLLCIGGTITDTSGRIGVLPKTWPGSLDIDSGYIDGAYAQFVVTTGALPDPAATIGAQAAWTGGMPLFFLDNNNA